MTIACLSSGICRAEPSSRPKEKEAAGAPTALAGQQPEPSSQTTDCKDPKHREQADCVQRRMADAAEKAVALADAQYIWNVAQAFGTVVAALAAAYAAIAASKAAKSSQRSADTSERALRGLERPWIYFDVRDDRFHVETVGGEFTIERRPHVTLEFTNFGKTSAVLGWIDYDLVHLTALPETPAHGRTVRYLRNRIMRADGQRSIPVNLGYALSDAAIESLQTGQSFIWLYGQLFYTQALDEIHETAFCWYYNGLTHAFEPYHEHNRMT